MSFDLYSSSQIGPTIQCWWSTTEAGIRAINLTFGYWQSGAMSADPTGVTLQQKLKAPYLVVVQASCDIYIRQINTLPNGKFTAYSASDFYTDTDTMDGELLLTSKTYWPMTVNGKGKGDGIAWIKTTGTPTSRQYLRVTLVGPGDFGTNKSLRMESEHIT